MSRRAFSSKTRPDIFGDFRNFETLSVVYKLLMHSLIDSKDDITNERKPRYIIEVNKGNLDYCRFLMKKIDFRHLDNLTSNFIIHENKYSFISTNIEYNLNANKNAEYCKDEEVSIVTTSTNEIVKQQQKIFDTLWHNSLPANEKIEELEKAEEKILDTNYYDFNNKGVGAARSLNKEDGKKIVQITRDSDCIKSLLVSGVYNAKSEILLAIGSGDHFKSFWKIGLEEGLKHAIDRGVKIIILYPEDGKSDITKNYIADLVSDMGKDVHLNGISGTFGSVMIADNAKILLMVDENDNISSTHDIIGLFSNDSSLVKNFGSLFDILVNEKVFLNYIVNTKNQLESSNKQAEGIKPKVKDIL